MKKTEVVQQACYIARVSGGMAIVQITGESVFGGWCARNLKTGRQVRIRSAARLRRRVTSEGRPLTPSGLPEHAVLMSQKRDRVACTCGYDPSKDAAAGDVEDKLVLHLALSKAMPAVGRTDSVVAFAAMVAARTGKPNLLTVLRPPDATACDGCPNPTCSDVELCLQKRGPETPRRTA